MYTRAEIKRYVLVLPDGITLTLAALDVPFLLLPFRPSSDPSAARTFVRNYFIPPGDRPKLKGGALENELRMTEVMVWTSLSIFVEPKLIFYRS